MNLSSLGIRSSHSLFNMVNLGLWQEGGKKTHSFPPLKVNKQGKHCHSHANGPCRRQIFSALSYLIHSSPRQRSEWLLCSNPPLLIPPSFTPPYVSPPSLHHRLLPWLCWALHSRSLPFRIKKNPDRVHRAATLVIFRLFLNLAHFLYKWCTVGECFWSP